MPDAGWAAVLDDLEKRLTLGEHTGWVPPTGLGPLPPELQPRARALLAAQQDAMRHAEAELDRLGRELTALRRPPGTRATDGAAYIDTVA